MKKLIFGITAPGSVILMEGQLKYFKELGYKTYLLAPDHTKSRNYCKLEGCVLLPVEIEREISIFKDLKSLINIIRILRSIKPDVINVGTPKMGLLGSIAGFLLGIKKRIYTCRGYRFEHETGLKRKILILMEKITAACSHKVLCISNSVRNFGIENYLFSAKKSLVINKGSSNGIPLERFDADKIDKSISNKLKQDLKLEKKFIFGFVGRLIDRKGVNELYEAFDKLYQINNSIRLLFVGPPEFEQLSDKELIPKMKKHPGIILAGFQKDVPLYLSLMDVFTLPAWWEGFGNVLVQAAAMGLPVISTTGTGTIDAVSDGFNGLLVSPKSVKELYEAINLLFTDSELREKLGKNGVIWSKNFKSEVIWDGMDKLYNE